MVGFKILSVATGIPDPNDSMWIRILRIAEGLIDRGNKVELISFLGPHTLDHFTFNFNKTNCRLIPTIKVNVFNKLLSILNRYRPNLVFANTHLPAFISLISKLKHIPLIFDMHGIAIEEIKMLAEEMGFWEYSQILLNLP